MRRVLALILALAAPAAADPVPGAAEALNAVRVRAGLTPVTLSAQLQTMADRHARDMAQKGYFSHQGADGSDIALRAGRVGYRFCALAENIAMGHGSLATVMDSWHRSAAHRRNMLNRDISEFGLARAKGDIWVMVLGRAGC